MPINPLTGLEEEDEYSNLFQQYDQQKKALDEENSGYDTRGAITGALASLAAGFQGKDSLAAVNQVMNRRDTQREAKSAALEKWKAGKVAELQAKRDQVKMKREDEDYARTAAMKKEEDDPNSQSSLAAQELASKYAPGMNFKGMSKSQISTILPSLENLFKLQQEKAKAAQDREDKLTARKEKSLSDQVKEKELSVAQAKQLGLFKSGALANQQFDEAVKNTEDYDPTAFGQWIDNSEWAPNWMKNDKAVAAQNAQSAWVEAFLRDASGAAIPPNERAAYAKDFFPQPGDTKDVVANKKMLREQKMRNAAVAAGLPEDVDMQVAKMPANRDSDAEKYAAMHNLDYETALNILNKRRMKNVVAGNVR